MGFAARPLWQTYAYDWLGNTTGTGDDANGFYDRSLGAITNGTAAAGPYQLRSAAGATGGLTAAYDAAGNMTSMAVERAGACLPAGAVCSQRYAYSWDEVGRLVRARRWDLAAPGNASDALPDESGVAADLTYTYDATDDRAIRAAGDATGATRYALYPLDALELRGADWESAGDYERTTATQAAYVFAHGVRLGRIAAAEEDEPSLTSGAEHVFLELPDHLGSTSIVVDRDTGELVEAGTYQSYGDADSDYRPERWRSFREDYRFTGKESDVEIGLQYSEHRYYVTSLSRWASADPLAVHAHRGDPNLYSYVRDEPLRSVDRTGLDGTAVAIEAGEAGGPAGIAAAAVMLLHQRAEAKFGPSSTDIQIMVHATIALANTTEWIASRLSGKTKTAAIPQTIAISTPNNPNGCNGKPDHQAVVAELVKMAEQHVEDLAKESGRPLSDYEILENLSIKNSPKMGLNRRPDAAIVNVPNRKHGRNGIRGRAPQTFPDECRSGPLRIRESGGDEDGRIR